MKVTVIYEDDGGDLNRVITVEKEVDDYIESVLFAFEDSLNAMGYSVEYLKAFNSYRDKNGNMKQIEWGSRL